MLDLIVGLMLLPAAIADSLTQNPVELRAETASINGRQFSLYRATRPEEWQHGFKGREVAADEAMLFEFPEDGWRMFWMKDTRTPLDIAFLDGDFRVRSVVRGARPCGLLCRPYFGRGKYVLEFRAGESRVTPGDGVVINRPTS